MKKCSLRGLETREDCRFISYPYTALPPLESYLLLDMEGEDITEADRERGILLLDATWRYAQRMQTALKLPMTVVKRRLPPHFRTAYPRVQTGCALPDQGLASIEALFLIYHLLGRSTAGLLDHYHWKHEFLEKNQLLVQESTSLYLH